MRLPRDVSARDLVRALARLGYVVTRQTGSHLRLTRSTPAESHVTIPAHDLIKLGTLNAILREVESQTGVDRDSLIRLLLE